MSLIRLPKKQFPKKYESIETHLCVSRIARLRIGTSNLMMFRLVKL
jgi:hypothetical protein